MIMPAKLDVPAYHCPNGLCAHGSHEVVIRHDGTRLYTCDTKTCPCRPRTCPEHGEPIISLQWVLGKFPIYQHADGSVHEGIPPFLSATRIRVTKLDEDGQPTGESFASESNVEVRILPDAEGSNIAPIVLVRDDRRGIHGSDLDG